MLLTSNHNPVNPMLSRCLNILAAFPVESVFPPCDVQIGWTQSEEGQAWIAAIEKDL